MPNTCACDVSLCARLFHTGICLAVPATLAWKDTYLHHWLVEGENLLNAVLYLSALAVSLSLYYITCLTDPGYVDRQKYRLQPGMLEEMEEGEVNHAVLSDDEATGHRGPGEEEEGEEEEEEEEGEEDTQCKLMKKRVKYRYCDSCEIMQPMRSKHCSECDRCVRKFDHHCPWLGACVGERNHKFFWSFLTVTLGLMFWTGVITWHGFSETESWSDWFHKNLVLFIDMAVLLIMGIIVGALWCFHSYLMLTGETTWEISSRERITYLKYLDGEYNPFNEGLCRNIYIFLCNYSEKRWELLYSIKARFKTSQNGFR